VVNGPCGSMCDAPNVEGAHTWRVRWLLKLEHPGCAARACPDVHPEPLRCAVLVLWLRCGPHHAPTRWGAPAGVKRVVVTSSVGAIVAPLSVPTNHVYSERDWNTESTPTSGAYYLSKTLAEKAAWEFSEREGLSVVVSARPRVRTGERPGRSSIGRPALAWRSREAGMQRLTNALCVRACV
jgi:hypothetical protein